MTRPTTLVAAVAAASLTIGVLAAGSAASAAPPPKTRRRRPSSRERPSTPRSSPGAAPRCRSSSRRPRTRRPTAPSSVPDAAPTRSRRRPRAARRCGSLPGQYVEFTLPAAANAITVRYSIPDAAGGGGLTAPLDGQGGAADEHAHHDLAVRATSTTSTRSRTTRTRACCTRTGGSPSAACVPQFDQPASSRRSRSGR